MIEEINVENKEELGCRLFQHYFEDVANLADILYPKYKSINRDVNITEII